MRNLRSRKRLLLILLIVLFLISFWAFNSFQLTVSDAYIHNSKIKNDIVIVQLTDLHGASFGRDNKKLLKAVDAQRPDFVVVTGDLYTGTKSSANPGMQTALALMKALADKYDVYYVNGEHDNDPAFFARLQSVGVTVLRNKRCDITIGGTALSLFGIGSVYFPENFNLIAKIGEPDPTRYNILLAHLENFDIYKEAGMDLSLCGDTHGGVVRLPFIGPVYFKERWFPRLRQIDTYDKGLYEENGAALYVSGGLGNYPLPLRLFNLPEISVIHLKPVQH